MILKNHSRGPRAGSFARLAVSALPFLILSPANLGLPPSGVLGSSSSSLYLSLCLLNGSQAARRDILRVLLHRLPCPFQPAAGPGPGAGAKVGPGAAGAGVGPGGATGAGTAGGEVDAATVAALAANSHGFVGADLQMVR